MSAEAALPFSDPQVCRAGSRHKFTFPAEQVIHLAHYFRNLRAYLIFLSMSVLRPINLQKWIDENRHLLKPPVGNKQIYTETKDFIVMIVGGPNSRKDYHLNATEELFYQIEGDIVVKIIEDGKPVDIHIRQGETFLLPGNVAHSPRRPANTIGLVVEKIRHEDMEDGFMWYCEACGQKLHEEFAPVSDIVAQLPIIMDRFWNNDALRTCSNCGTYMEKPQPPTAPN
jgi:3-hydroxyanthranilate 3,4-dioxygenase